MVKGKENNKVVYIHKYPGSKTVYYVGLGVESRPYDFVRRSKFWLSTYEKYGVEVEIVATDLTFDQACLIEQTLINLYGRRDIGTGSLVNHTDGGLAPIGLSPEKRKQAGRKTSQKMMGRTRPKHVCTAVGMANTEREWNIETLISKTELMAQTKVRRLSKRLVETIIRLGSLNNKKFSIKAISIRFNVSYTTVRRILNGTSPYLKYYNL